MGHNKEIFYCRALQQSIVRVLTNLRRMTNAINYNQNVFYMSNFGINLLAFYYEWLRYSLSIKQLDYELKLSIA